MSTVSRERSRLRSPKKEEREVTDNANSEGLAATEFAQRWITTMQSMADQIQRHQHTFQQMMQDSMNTYMQLLNTPPFSVAEQSQQAGQQATQHTFQQASQQWMELAHQQQQTFQQMSQQWMEQAQAQQQAFQRMVQQSLSTYTNLLGPPR